MRIHYLAFVLIGLLVSAYAAPAEEEVQYSDLPNLPDGLNTQSKLYSGYLPLPGTTKKYHYMFVQSQNSPGSDPVVLWFQGGPGCSGLFGFIGEMGPFVFPDGGDKLIVNPFPWNKQANLLFIESPTFVGFSYSTNPADLNTTDNQTAIDNLQAIATWFSKFPEYRQNDFYITGESYAGMYIPFVTNNIIDYNAQVSDYTQRINLKGVAIGNGCTNWKYDNMYAQFDQFYWRALYSHELRQGIEKYCIGTPGSAQCLAVIAKINTLLENINVYDIYGTCYPDQNSSKISQSEAQSDNNVDLPPTLFPCYTKYRFYKSLPPVVQQEIRKKAPLKDGNCLNQKPFRDYFNLPQVQTALHIDNVPFKWSPCSDPVATTFEVDERGSIWAYPKILESGIRILKFSGDADGCVPTTGTLRWIREFQKDYGLVTKSAWRPWFYPGLDGDDVQVGGFVEEYEKGFTLITIRGAGHMSPRWRRQQTQQMLNNFISNTPMVQTNREEMRAKSNSKKAEL